VNASPTDWFRRVDTIFDAAVDLPADQQSAAVERACGADEVLRAEVLSLLRAYRSDSPLESPAAAIAAPLFEPSARAASDRIGPFRIVREIGRGGMGHVLLGERADGQFEQRVAIKLIQHGSAGVVRRFLEERRILALLEHPNIARLVDGGLTSDGLPYFAMELVDGEPIDRYCESRHLPLDARLELFARVCDAVAYAHQHLVIHRDLKPSNILVAADGQVKLLDFGIAKLLGDAQGDDLTGTGLSPMTPQFAAPEQIRNASISTATDVYSLGVLLYLLLTGERPYDLRGKPPTDVERIVCVDVPPKPSSRAAGALARRLRGDLDLIVMTALQKDEQRRYQSPATLAHDLQRFLQGRPILARPDTARYRFGKFVRRNRTAVAVATATAAALVGATVFSIAQMREARRQQREAVRAAQRATALSELQTVLAGDARDPDGRPLPPAGRIAMAEGVIERRFGSDPSLAASLMVDLSGRYVETGNLKAQRAMLGKARTIARKANLGAEVALAACWRANSYWLEDLLDSARADVAEGKAALARDAYRDHEAEATCLEAEGKLLQATGQPDSGIALLKRAVAVEDEPGGTEALGRINSLAEVLRLSGRIREAVPYFRRILAQLEALGYGETDAFPNVVNFLATSLTDLGELAVLDSTLHGYIRPREAEYGEGRVPTLLAFIYARAKLRLGEIDSADLWLTRAMRDTTQGAGQFANYLTSTLAELRLDQMRLADARVLAARLPATRRGQRATTAMLRARLKRADGDPRGASTFLEAELGTLWNDGQERLTQFALPLVTAGEWRLANGDAHGADSLAVLARTAAVVDSVALVRSALAGRAELLRAQALHAGGRAAEARQAAQRAVTALGNGYGRNHRWTRAARALADSLRG
jgi:serine/threonine-protein kinase